MPRKPKKSVSEIYEALKELNFLYESSLRPYNDPVWQSASDLLDGVLNKDYVYLYITKNRNGTYKINYLKKIFVPSNLILLKIRRIKVFIQIGPWINQNMFYLCYVQKSIC